jgi:hypothetical protein
MTKPGVAGNVMTTELQIEFRVELSVPEARASISGPGECYA